jgi:dTDP-4-dehydrorhamnose reductase
MKTSIIGTGLSGMVGSRVVELLNDQYEFYDMSLKTRVDITDYNQVLKFFKEKKADIVIHLAAKTDVDACEDDKILGEEGGAWQINVIGTKNIIEAARRFNKRIIYISTDFVFNGTKEYYQEDDEPDPLNWYGETKYRGEQIVEQSSLSYCIVRLAYPFRSFFPEKLDFVRRIIEKGEKGEKIFALTDHIFTPTFIDDIAKALGFLIHRDLVGIFHLVGSQFLTPFQATEFVFRAFKVKGSLEAIERETYFRDRAFRPFKLRLKNDKITKLGIKMRTFEEGLIEMKKQLL